MTEVLSGTINNTTETELKILETLVNNNQDNHSNNFRITKGAFSKAMTYAKVIGKIAGGGMECYGYLLKPSDSLDNIITDIYFAADQSDSSAYVRVSEEGVYQASQELDPKGYMIVGWWHSHGTFSTFHSGTDVDNFKVVLHSIAPLTMFRKEKSAFTYNREIKELTVNGVKIKGVELQENLSGIEVIKKVEQDPYAFSMVVNMFEEYYLEKQTKTLSVNNKSYHLNNPTRPLLETVNKENDVEFVISQIEDDVTGKVHMRTQLQKSVERVNNFYNPEENKKLIREFSKKAVKSRIDSVRNYLSAVMNDSKNPLQAGKAEEGFSISEEKLEEKLLEQKKDIPTSYCLNQAYDIQSLRDELNLHFMKDYVESPDKVSETAEKYASFNSMINKYFELSVRAGKSLSKYSMERFTDYDNEVSHKYRNFVSHFVDNLRTDEYVSMSESLKTSDKKKYDQANKDLYLYYDRLKIINNLMSSLVFKEDERRHEGFLKEFADEFDKNPKSENLDRIIEKGLLPKNADEKTIVRYQDRKNYERKGIFPKVMTHIKTYFGGKYNGRY